MRLAAAPVDGAANAALIDCLAAALRCPPRAVTILSGQRTRTKIVRVSGLSDDELRGRLDGILAG